MRINKTFDWAAFGREEIAVHCKTEKEAIDFCKQSHEHGFDWNSGEGRDKKIYWDIYEEETVYYKDTYGGVIYAKQTYSSMQIIEWANYMPSRTFTKSDLKTGDIVLKRNGGVEIAILEIGTGVLINKTGYNTLSHINEDLTSSLENDCFDIVRVRRPVSIGDCQFNCFERGYGELVYDREAIEAEQFQTQVEEMTMEEICQALGKNIKIVKNKEN